MTDQKQREIAFCFAAIRAGLFDEWVDPTGPVWDAWRQLLLALGRENECENASHPR